MFKFLLSKLGYVPKEDLESYQNLFNNADKIAQDTIKKLSEKDSIIHKLNVEIESYKVTETKDLEDIANLKEEVKRLNKGIYNKNTKVKNQTNEIKNLKAKYQYKIDLLVSYNNVLTKYIDAQAYKLLCYSTGSNTFNLSREHFDVITKLMISQAPKPKDFILEVKHNVNTDLLDSSSK